MPMFHLTAPLSLQDMSSYVDLLSFTKVRRIALQ